MDVAQIIFWYLVNQKIIVVQVMSSSMDVLAAIAGLLSKPAMVNKPTADVNDLSDTRPALSLNVIRVGFVVE